AELPCKDACQATHAGLRRTVVSAAWLHRRLVGRRREHDRAAASPGDDLRNERLGDFPRPGRTANPTGRAAALGARSVLRAGRSLAYAIRRPWWPLLALAARRYRRAGLAIGGASAVALIENTPTRPSDAALAIADDLIAAAGTWWSCLRYRAVTPLLPSRHGKALSSRQRVATVPSIPDVTHRRPLPGAPG